MEERRRFSRNEMRFQLRFRVVKAGPEPQMSGLVEARVRNISIDGVAMESPVIEADGLHISYNEHPSNKNRIFLQWELPTGKSVKAVGETVWFERAGGGKPLYVVGIRFIEISQESLQLLKDFLQVTSGGRPVPI